MSKSTPISSNSYARLLPLTNSQILKKLAQFPQKIRTLPKLRRVRPEYPSTGMKIRAGAGAGMKYSKVIALVAILVFSFVGDVSALSVTVNDVECVQEFVLYEGDTISGNFVVLDYDTFWSSDHPGIDFTVTSPAGNVVHTMKGTAGDKFEFKAPKSGMFKFCFHNPHSAPETVSFYIHIGHITNEHDIAKDEHLDPVNVRIAELREALESVTAEQDYLKARDSRHRHTNQSTRDRVIFYTVVEYILLILASGLQVMYIRSLFSKSIGYNRI